MQNTLITPPLVEPVTLAAARTQLRFDDDITVDDDFITGLITEARTYFELRTGLALITQTWLLTFDYFPGDGQEPWWDGVREGAISEIHTRARYIELGRAPLQSVTSFKAYAQDDSSTNFTDYLVDKNRRPGRIGLRTGSIWPTATRGVGNYEIEYKAGFGDAADNVPADIKTAIRQIVAHWYENREIMVAPDIAGRDVPRTADNIIKARRIVKL